MARGSAWRVSDATVYDAMRESAITLTNLLLTSLDGSDSDAVTRAEVARLRGDVLSVDGFDRAAVTTLASVIDVRIGELNGAAR